MKAGMIVRAAGMVAGCGVVGVAAGQSYTAVPLGSLGGTGGAVALGVNSVGDVVGQSDTNSGVAHGFFWHAGTMADLGELSPGQPSRAVSVNTAGVVVGTAKDAAGQDRAVKWERDGQGVWRIQDIGTLPGGTFAMANRISESGIIVGRSGVTNGRYHGFILSGGVMTDVGILGYPANLGYSEALGVNADGKATGYAYAPLWGPDHGWYYDRSATDITPPGQFSFARGYAINASGVVGGTTILPGGQSTGFEAAIYTPGAGWTEIGVIEGLTESEGYDISDSGYVVGRSFDLSIDDIRGFVYRGGRMYDLMPITTGSPAPIIEADAINGAGQIVATADDGAVYYALLLNPAAACYANCDGSTAAPILNVNDFVCFLNKFGAGDPAANCDGSTVEPVLNVNDFVCFQTKFAQGCP